MGEMREGEMPLGQSGWYPPSGGCQEGVLQPQPALWGVTWVRLLWETPSPTTPPTSIFPFNNFSHEGLAHCDCDCSDEHQRPRCPLGAEQWPYNHVL